ncbi:hypothetical protein [Bacillus salipaludis]|uniref:hypothetical protein n=1 Tax=Bacillus salipaludis TaxID=2547811 RepID=UPI003D1E5BDA
MEKFLNFLWPGNIRELRNVIERLVVFSTDGTIKEEDLPLNLLNINSRKKSNHHSVYLNSEGLAEENITLMSESLQKELYLFEKKLFFKHYPWRMRTNNLQQNVWEYPGLPYTINLINLGCN